MRENTPELRRSVRTATALMNWLCLAVILAFSLGVSAQATPRSAVVRGRVVDAAGASIASPAVSLTDSRGRLTKAVADIAGQFSISVSEGVYSLRVASPGFRDHFSKIAASADRALTVDITMEVNVITEDVTVDKPPPINTDPEGNTSAIVLKKDDLRALPDDPAELQEALQALAGPGGGPAGGEIFIDGFSGGRLPRKQSISEVRINQNPFSSEYERPGYGRIEIITKPGSEDWTGELAGEFEDESLNARNPFATNRPPYQLRNFNGTLSGPIKKDRLSFLTELEREAVDNNLLVNAVTLGAGLEAVPFQRAFLTRSTNWDLGQRFDAKIGKNHTFSVRFSRETFRSPHTAFGGFELPSTGWASKNSEYFIRVTETAVISPTVVSETRFQFMKIRESQDAVAAGPAVRVLDAFTSGGSVGNALNLQGRHEITNITSVVRGNHVIRTGMRLRRQSIDDISPTNYQGTFTFSSLDQYRNTILNLPGAVPTQFTISGGDPQASVTRWDVGMFFQDDIKARPDLTLSLGLRYERQNRISSPYDLAPRVAVAWAPGNTKDPPKTVYRAGFGIFYDRFTANQSLQTIRFDGIRRRQFVVTDPAILDPIVFTLTGASNIPDITALAAFQQPQVIRTVDPRLRSPFTAQVALSAERQLPFKTTVSVSYIHSRVRRMLRSRNINAPVAGIRPDPTKGNIHRYESTARLDQDQLVVNFRSNESERFSLFGNYSLGRAKGDGETAGTFPANQYDLNGEYGNSTLDVRHRFTIGATLKAPLGLEFSPFIVARSGMPFNITTGTDVNGDTLFTDRPAFGLVSEPGNIVTRFGTFDPTPEPGDTIIPRNFGRGPGFIQVNLQMAKTFRLSRGSASKDKDEDGGYELEFIVKARNIFNHVNGGTPVGNLSSSFFGRSVATSAGAVGNRRILLEAVFRF